MTQRRAVKILSNGPQIPIPKRSVVAPPSEGRSYKLCVNASGNFLNFYFKKNFSERPGTTIDQPLDMRVPGPCLITLELDDPPKWSFRKSDETKQLYAVMLIDPPDAEISPGTRYYNFSYINESSVSFYADFYNKKGNHDSLNIYLDLKQTYPDGSPAQTLAIVIDPDIKNPGDPQNLDGP